MLFRSRWIWDKQPDHEYAENNPNISAIEEIDSPNDRPNMEYTHTLSRDLLAMRQLTEFSDVIVKANETPMNLHLLIINLRYDNYFNIIIYNTALDRKHIRTGL